MITITNPDGKDIECYPKGNSIKLRFVGGGELPPALSGSYTNQNFAKIAVLKYFDSKKQIVDKKAEKAKDSADKRQREAIQQKFLAKQA